jgi:hypothetical protein
MLRDFIRANRDELSARAKAKVASRDNQRAIGPAPLADLLRSASPSMSSRHGESVAR